MSTIEYIGGPFDGLRDEVEGVIPAIINIEQAAALSPKGEVLRDRWTGSYVYPNSMRMTMASTATATATATRRSP